MTVLMNTLKSSHRTLLAAAVGITFLLPVNTASACACCGTYRVINVASWDVLNVRTGPGTRFRIIHTLEPGEGCIIQTGERSGNWVRVQVADLTGWVHSRYLGYIR